MIARALVIDTYIGMLLCRRGVFKHTWNEHKEYSEQEFEDSHGVQTYNTQRSRKRSDDHFNHYAICAVQTNL